MKKKLKITFVYIGTGTLRSEETITLEFVIVNNDRASEALVEATHLLYMTTNRPAEWRYNSLEVLT